jgi:hypothetical protein
VIDPLRGFVKALALLLSATAPVAGSAAPNILAGQWEIVTEPKVPKLPFGMGPSVESMIPRPATRRVCISESDLARPEALVKTQTGCNLQQLREADGALDWRVSCTSQPPSTASGTAAVKPDFFRGTATVTTVTQGFQLAIPMTYRGRRLGACPP